MTGSAAGGGGEKEMAPPGTSGDKHRRGTKTQHSGQKREMQSTGQQVHDRAVRSQHLKRNNAPVRREASSQTTTTTQRIFPWMPPDHPAHIRANQTRVSPPTKLAAQGAARRGRHAKTYRHDPHRHPSQPSRCQKKEATTEAASPTVAVLGIPVAPRARTAAGSGETRQRERTRVRKRRAGGMRQSHVRRQWPGLRSGRN